MDSDSDRTIDSDELDSLITNKKKISTGKTSKKKAVRHSEKSEFDSDKTIDSDELESVIAGRKKITTGKTSKREAIGHSAKFHGISDSDSDVEIPQKKTKVVQENRGSKSKDDELDKRPICKYGEQCYRKNPDHIRVFAHPKMTDKDRPLIDKAMPQNYENFGIFLTKVHGIHHKFNDNLTLGIKDILSSEDSKLISSVHFNYMFDIPWLIQQYPERYRQNPLLIVHGEQNVAKKRLEDSGAAYPNVKFCQAKLEIPYGTHHTKMMFLHYEAGLKVIIHTSNIVEGDWHQKTQGIWMSPLLSRLPNGTSSTEGESPTNFKADLLEYISSYKSNLLVDWCQVIESYDFSIVKVVLIGSIPGRHVGSKKTAFGHLKLRKVLTMKGPSKGSTDVSWPVVGQFSSIGSLGAAPDVWLSGEFLTSLATCSGSSTMVRSPPLKLIYPSVENVRKSLEGYPAGASLPYSYKVAAKQTYLKKFLHQWKSEKFGRSEASPHIKSYLRVSPDNSSIAWFLVTSANLSKAAWGSLEKKGTQLMIRSYELGVLFLPSYFEMESFSVSCQNQNVFPVPFDIPLVPYSDRDEPWTWDRPHISAPDNYGNMWCPP